MKCPRCGWIADHAVVRCPGCDFSLEALDRQLGTAPASDGPLDDGARVLSDEARDRLAARLAQLAESTGGAWIVVTRHSTAPVRPAEYAFWLFNHRGLEAHRHRGMLVLLSLREQRIETEVGSAWEAAAGDLETGRVLDAHVVPLLRQRDYEAALFAAIEELAKLVPTAPSGGAR